MKSENNFKTGSNIRISLSLCAVTLLCVIWNTGCDNTLDPLDKERGIFSIYGGLDLNSEINYLRVRNLNQPILENEMQDFNGTVSITNKRTSETAILNDTLINIQNVFVRNFITTMPIEPETAYEVIAITPEGKQVKATATSPAFAEVSVLPVAPDCTTRVNIDFDPVNTGGLEPEVGFEWNGEILWQTLIPERGEIGESNDLRRVSFTPRRLISVRLREARWCSELPDNKFYLRYIHYGPEFNQSIDSDNLNIPGGAGTLGAYYREFQSFEIDRSVICDLSICQ